MRQLALQIQSTAQPTLDNFIPGRNAEVLAAVRATAAAGNLDGQPHLLYWWGGPDSGKSHLLLALAESLRARGLAPAGLDGRSGMTAGLAGSLLLVDNVDGLAPPLAEQLFHAWNRIREQGGLLACTGSQVPAQLPLAPELTSRLAWGQVFRLQALDDADRLQALRERAQALALPVTEDVLVYLLARTPRSLHALLDLLDQLDAYSLAARRPITIPLVRELLHARAAPASLLEPMKCD